MNEIINTFSFEDSNINIIVKDGEPWFCAKDVCDALGYQNARDALSKHCSSKGVAKRDLVKTLSNGRQQTFQMTFVDERNLYRLIMRSKLESAVRFQDWVCGEVLPQIRKTGSYGQASVPSLPDFTNPAIAARAWAEQFEQRQVAESKIFALTNQIKADKPKIDLADKFLDSTGDFIIRMVAKALGVGVMKLYDWMRQKKLISKTNEPYAEFCTRGILRPVPGYHEGSNGERKCKLTTHVTSKGVFYLHQRLISDGLIPAGKQIDFECLMTKEAA